MHLKINYSQHVTIGRINIIARKCIWNIVFTIGVRSKGARFLAAVWSFVQSSQSACGRAWWNFISHHPYLRKNNFLHVFRILFFGGPASCQYIFLFYLLSLFSFSHVVGRCWREINQWCKMERTGLARWSRIDDSRYAKYKWKIVSNNAWVNSNFKSLISY